MNDLVRRVYNPTYRPLGPSTIRVRCWTCNKASEIPQGCRVNPCPTCLRYTRTYASGADRYRNTGSKR